MGVSNGKQNCNYPAGVNICDNPMSGYSLNTKVHLCRQSVAPFARVNKRGISLFADIGNGPAPFVGHTTRSNKEKADQASTWSANEDIGTVKDNTY